MQTKSPACFVSVLVSLYFVLSLVSAKCYQPSPAYIPPDIPLDSPSLSRALSELEEELNVTPLPDVPVADFAFSVELTSMKEKLWSFHRSSVQDKESRLHRNIAGNTAQDLGSRSIYRIASITKVFTIYAVLIAAERGLLELDKPITEYLPHLEKSNITRYNAISLRSLGSQLSGIPRDSDAMMGKSWGLGTLLPNPGAMGYPPVDPSNEPSCGDPSKAFDCSSEEFLDELITQRAAFSPNFKSSYSNIAFTLLGLALERVTGKAYNDIVQEWIFVPLGMAEASLEKPIDSNGVIIGPRFSAWGTNLGLYNATGGMYSSTDSLSRFMRHVLSNPDLANAWLQPASYTPGGVSAYGMPWEILHTPRFLPDHGNRPITFYTKNGNINGYSTNIVMLPEQGIGISFLTASYLPHIISWIRDRVTSKLIPTIENIALDETAARYAGTYTTDPSSSLNSSLTLSVSRTKGLHIDRWISNGSDFLTHFESINQGLQPRPSPKGRFHTQLIPSFLREPFPSSSTAASSQHHTGEMWHVHFAPHRDPHILFWDDFCLEDVGGWSYVGRDVNKFVFDVEEPPPPRGSHARALHIPGLRVTLQRVSTDAEVRGDGLGLHASKPDVERKPSWFKGALDFVSRRITGGQRPLG